jgi:hypothetical protein
LRRLLKLALRTFRLRCVNVANDTGGHTPTTAGRAGKGSSKWDS